MTDTRSFCSGFILYKTFSLHSKRDSKVNKNNGTDPEVKKNSLMRKKSEKMLHVLQKANMRAFYAKQEISLF